MDGENIKRQTDQPDPDSEPVEPRYGLQQAAREAAERTPPGEAELRAAQHRILTTEGELFVEKTPARPADGYQELREMQDRIGAFEDVLAKVGDKTGTVHIEQSFQSWNSPEARGAVDALTRLASEGREVEVHTRGPFDDDADLLPHKLSASLAADGDVFQPTLTDPDGRKWTEANTNGLETVLPYQADNGAWRLVADVGPRPEHEQGKQSDSAGLHKALTAIDDLLKGVRSGEVSPDRIPEEYVEALRPFGDPGDTPAELLVKATAAFRTAEQNIQARDATDH